MILHGWRNIASAWIIVLALIFGPTIALGALKALNDFPQQNTDWEGVANPRHDGALIIRIHPPMETLSSILVEN
jgi:hypothetical protein